MNSIASRKVVMAIDIQEGGFKMHAIANKCLQLPLERFARNVLPGGRIHNCQ